MPANATARKVRDAADVTSYDAWMRERTGRAHAEFMRRTSGCLPSDRSAEEIAPISLGGRGKVSRFVAELAFLNLGKQLWIVHLGTKCKCGFIMRSG